MEPCTRAFPFLEEKDVLSPITMIVGVAESWVGVLHRLWGRGFGEAPLVWFAGGATAGWNLLVTFRLW